MSDYDTVGGGTSGAVSGALSGAQAGAAFGPIGMGIGAVIGGLFGKKKTKVPKPPTYSQMMNYNLDAQAGIQSKLLGLEETWRPKYQGLQETTLNNQLYGGEGNAGYINMLNQSNAALAGVQANAAQGFMGTMAGLTPMARNMMLSPQAAAMQQALMAQAQAGIDAGTGLTAQDRRQAFQSANMAMAQRGMTGRQGVAAGVLSNYGLGLQRQDRARQFGSGILSQDSALQSAAMQMASGAMAQYNAGGAFMGQANAMLGQYQPQIFQPESQMGAQAQGMAYQQQMGVAMAKQQSQANLLSSLGSFGSFAAQNPNLFKFGGSPTINNMSMNIGDPLPSYGNSIVSSNAQGGFGMGTFSGIGGSTASLGSGVGLQSNWNPNIPSFGN
jgi:hypothetical protein